MYANGRDPPRPSNALKPLAVTTSLKVPSRWDKSDAETGEVRPAVCSPASGPIPFSHESFWRVIEMSVRTEPGSVDQHCDREVPTARTRTSLVGD